MLLLGMEMVHVLPRWLDMTMEVDIEGEVQVMVVEATGVVEATVAVAMVAAPAPTGEAIEGVPEVAMEVTTEGLVEEATEDLGDSSEEVAEGAMGVATLDKEEEVVAIKACLCQCLCIDR